MKGCCPITPSASSQNILQGVNAYRLKIDTHSIESVCIKLVGNGHSIVNDTIICSIYRPPRGGLKEFVTKLILENVHNYPTYIFGDFNIDLGRKSENSEMLLNTGFSYGFFPIIDKPTRVHNLSKTIIDNIFTNSYNAISDHYILVSDISDHYALLITTETMEHKGTDITLKRKINRKNIDTFIQTVKSYKYVDILKMRSSSEAYNCFHNILIDTYEKSFPFVKPSTTYKDRLSWVDAELKKSIKVKNKMYIKSKRHPTVENQKNYKLFLITVNKQLKSSIRNYYKNLLSEGKNDMKKQWRILKEIAGRLKTSDCPTFFTSEDGSREEDHLSIAENCNTFFSQIGQHLANKIPTENVDVFSYLPNPTQQSIFLNPVTPNEIKKVIANLKDRAGGWDNISKNLIINILDYILIPLTHIINLTMETSVFPPELKIAKIKPLF